MLFASVETMFHECRLFSQYEPEHSNAESFKSRFA